MKPGAVVRRLGIAVLVLLVLDVALGRMVFDRGRLLGHPLAPFDPPLFGGGQFEALERIRERIASGVDGGLGFDAQLGWCPRPGSRVDDAVYDWAGARVGVAPLARERAAGTGRVVVVGCSMTHGDEVSGPETWAAVCDRALDDVEVANLGVSAYGLDQAVLRLRRDGLPLAPDEVWLGLLPAACLRVTTFYRPLLRHWSSSVAFKPRFVLAADGSLELLPSPTTSLADTPLLLGDQELFLERLAADSWIRRAPLAYAPRGSHPLHHSLVGRLALTLHEAGGRDLVGALGDPDHECFRIVAALVREAARAAEASGARFRLLVLPGEEDLRLRLDDGEPYWSRLVTTLEAEGIEVVDLGPTLVPDAPRAGLFMPNGHYGPEGNRLVGEELARRWSARAE